jgi:hypothetical protein
LQRSRAAQQDTELVAARARDDVVFVDGLQSGRDLDENFVADLMSFAFVDVPEAVEVDERECGGEIARGSRGR